MPKLLKCGVSRISGDMNESWTDWAFYTPDTSDEYIIDQCSEEGSDGPGARFARRPRIVRNQFRVFVTQECGYDI
jgi:hypothetical protein